MILVEAVCVYFHAEVYYHQFFCLFIVVQFAHKSPTYDADDIFFGRITNMQVAEYEQLTDCEDPIIK